MLKRNRTLSVIMTLCLCLALLAPVFVAPQAAEAATVTASGTPVVSKAAGQNLGSLIVDFGVIGQGYHQAVVKLPSSFVISAANNNENARVSNMCGANCPAVAAIAPVAPGGVFGGAAGPRVEYQLVGLTGNQMQLTVYSYGTYQEVKLGIALNGVTVPNSAGASVDATVMKLDGDFPDVVVPVAKTSAGAIDVLRTDPPTWSAAQWNTTNFDIHIREDVAGGLGQGAATLKIKLPKGYSWNACTANLFPGTVGLPAGETVTGTFTDPRVLVVNRTTVGGVPAGKYTFTLNVGVTVDENEAATGDVIATISGSSTSNTSELKLGAWADYGYSVTADNKDKEVTAGLTGESISKLVIKENIAASLLAGRSIIATLPNGVEWSSANFNATNKSGGLSINFVRNANDLSKATGTIVNAPGSPKGECWLEGEVNVAVNYNGPIEIEFSGSAGVNDTIQVANAVAPITASADVKDVKIGVQGQEAGSITITENKAEAIQSRTSVGAATTLVVEAPFGVTWAKLPTVKVAEGDLSLGTVTRGYSANGKHQLQMPIRSQSTKASKIEISDISFTVDRTVPEGSLSLSVMGTALDQAAIANRTVAASVVAANCVTPAPGEGTTGSALGQFKIGSNIYEINGVSKVMDAAPYIKGDRTYVPVRYLGYALGVAEADVVWDEATQKVTLTKGDNVVEMTIGSTTITVNGEANTMDVAPEITNDRTMLPARYVAEGLGYVVGWDPGTQTVLLSK